MESFPDLRALQILDALFETRGVGACARRLGLSQPSVSRTLAELRRHFGDPLLMRAPSGMVLTPRAEALRAPLAEWLAEGRAILGPGAEDPAQARRRFRVAASDYGMLTVIGPAMAALQRRMPHITLATEVLGPESPRRLQDGALDLLVTGFEPDPSQFHARHLFADGFTCLARRGHPVAQQPVSLDSFLAWPHIAVIVAETESDPLRQMLPKGRARQAMLETFSFAAAPIIAAQSDGLVILPLRAARIFARMQDLVEVPIPVVLGGFGYWLAWHERSRRDPVLAALTALLARAVEVAHLHDAGSPGSGIRPPAQPD